MIYNGTTSLTSLYLFCYLCAVYYLCVCDYDAHEYVSFAHFFFNKQNKIQSSLVTRNILPPHISQSILLTCKGRVDTKIREVKFVNESFCAAFYVNNLLFS